MTKYFIGVVIIVLTLGCFLLFNQEKPEEFQGTTIQPSTTALPTTEKVEATPYKASFAIFTHGTFRVFTGAMYHNQSKDVFIQADNPNIVTVRKSDTTWSDFFKTLPFKLTKECLITGTGESFCANSNDKLRFYLNTIENPAALDKQINNGDQLLVTYGNENNQQIQNQLQKLPLIK